MRHLNFYPAVLLLILAAAFTSCKKDAASTATPATLSTTMSGAITLGTISTTSTSGTTTTSTIVAVNCFGKHSKADSVAFSALPSSIGTYLNANYSGYTFVKAGKIDSASVITGYITVIKYNSNFVALKFNASGTFITTLEQRDKDDIDGPGYHKGGPFEDRDGRHKDTIALSAIPSTVKSAFTAKYPTDTLLHASVTEDSTYILISKNNGLFATAISKTGTILKHEAMPNPPVGRFEVVAIEQTKLPSSALTYLTTTYPSYVFTQALKITVNGTLKGYEVFITSNSTRYLVGFDASGNFVKAITLH